MSPEMNWIRQMAIFASVASAGPIYTLTDLGTLGGGSILAQGVNSLGQVAGTVTSRFGSTLAFSSNGLLPGSPGATESQASSINDAGQIAGTQYIGGQSYASVWSGGAAAALVGGAGSFATAIDNAGEVVGMAANGQAFAVQNGVAAELGAFNWSSAYAVNSEGEVAGYAMMPSGNFRGFVWTPGQGDTVLGTLGGASSYAMGINSAGWVTGSAQVASGYSHAFLWNGTSMQDLGTLGGASSYGYGINDLGVLVGASWTAGNTTAGNTTEDGFIYENGVMWDINALLEGAPGWQITALYGINDSNQVVGVGVLNGVEHAVLLTDPPAPIVLTSVSTSVSTSLDASVPEPGTCCGTLAGLLLLRLLLGFQGTGRPRLQRRRDNALGF
jgi:probable HAF family extracellular repeat protein